MFETNNNNNLKNENNELNISFFNFMNYFSKIQPDIYEQLSNNKKSLSFCLLYSEKIISIYINDNTIKINKILDNKIKARNIEYIIKILKNRNINLKYKSSFNCFQNKINYLFITFNYNLFVQFILNKKIKDLIKRRKVNLILNSLLNKILFIIGKLYIDKIINDDFFEMILRLLLIFTISKSENESNEKDEIIHLMFLKSCFNLIKNVFNYLFLIQNKYTSLQEIIINKIIVFMKDNIVNFNDNSKRIAYINKVFLSKYESKTLLLVDLYSIISKIKSETIINNFMDLLTNIYYFKYENVRRSMMRQLEPLFININKKNIKQLESDINLSDFSISLMNSLIRKEDKILKEHSCLIKQGFYFGNDISGLVCDINSLENEFIIVLGFMIESNKMIEITLFNIINNKDKSTELKLFLRKINKENVYELLVESKNITESTTRIYIECNSYYILSIHFKIGGLFQSSSMKIYYIKDNIILENEKKKFKNGQELKIKNFKIENFSIYFGCDINSKDPDKIINMFRGFIGDIIILNSKNIKNNNIDSFHELLLSLKGNYRDILYIIGETQENNIFLNNFNSDKNIKDKIISFSEKEDKLLDDIKVIISSNLFQLIDYQDDMDNTDLNKYNKNDLDENNQVCIKKKYSEFKIKSEALDERVIKIYTNIFDKNFHIFKNESTRTEFIKYDGINYLSLLFEYYYQILSHLCVIKNDNNKKDIEDICHKIEKKIVKILDFFNDNIKINEIINTNYEVINKFYYQMTITLLKYMELNSLDKEIILCLLNLLDGLVIHLNDAIDSIKTNLFDFLLNPKIYKEKGENQIQKLSEVLKHLYLIIKNNSNNDSQFIKNINSVEYLNKILSFIWIFDNNINLENNNKIYNENGLNDLLQNTKKYYSNLLIHFLISTTFKNSKISYNRNFSQKIESIFIIDNNNDSNIKISKTEKLDINEKNDIKLLTFFFDKTLEYNNTNIYIFSNMCSVLLNSNLLGFIDEFRIDKIKDILLKTFKKKMNYEHKQLKFISCLKILLGFYYYFDKTNKSNQTINKNKDQIFNTFIKNMNLSFDFFYALISSLKLINCFSNSINDQDELTVEKIITNINNNQIKKENIENKEDNNNNIFIIPLQEINLEKLKNLNDIQIHIIKIIFEDIVYLLKNESKNKNDNKNTKFEEIYKNLKKNIDYIFKLKETKIYQEIFSSETDICAEFFYLKWKLGNNNDVEYVLSAITKYHKDLLKYHLNPFIFKFYLYILYTEKMSQTENTKIALLKLIVETLYKYKNDLNNIKDKNHINLINNILNFLVLLNEELETNTIITQNNQSNIFQNNNFSSIFYKYITLLEMSSLMYSNYYIEIDDNIGKIVSEVIFDIFFMIPDFNKEEFMNIFTRENIFTVFYLMDICKEKILDKDKKTYEELKNIIPIDNLRYIHKNYFGKMKTKQKIKLILDRKVCPIEKVNFSIYFLGKGFVYLREKKFITINKGKIYNLLKESFLPLLTQNMFRLYTRKSYFYGNKNCPKFLLYYFTKTFFETFMIQNPNNFNKYVNYFDADMILNLKDEYNIKYCYSSRLINEKITDINIIRKTVDPESNTCVDDVNENDVNNDNVNEVNDNLNTQGTIKNDTISRINTFRHMTLIFLDDFEDIPISKNMISSIEVKESNKSLEYLKEPKEKNIEYFTAFELIKKGNNIYNPKNYFLKIIFAEIYKNITFNDKAFKLIKSTYLSSYRNDNIHKDSKQINYPIKQKNFSNSVEPKIFMRRDYNFYDENYINVSHSYLKKDLLNKEIENIFFYPHEYKIKMQKKDIYSLFCELVTPLYVYFGKMYFFENYMFFETEKEDIRDINKNIETFIKFIISNESIDNKALKPKSILIFNNDINEIIQRRTLFSPQSIEIFHKNGKSYFFNFFSVENINKVYKYLNEINKNLFNFNTNNNEDNIKNLKNSFHKGKISNYEYILYLNKYATRTYNDLSQYPVFPWLILEYDRITEILGLLEKKEIDKENIFRDMKYPISMQTEENRNIGRNMFEGELKDGNEFPFHLGNHYSTPGYIAFYLIRINPYEQNLIRLQGNKYDLPNRLFNSFSEIEKIIDENRESREIIPDFFCYFDFYCNLNCSFFGKKQKGDIIDDFNILNKDYSQYINIVSIYANSLYNNKKLLNDIYISRILYDWVDIIFGKKQLPKEEERYECYNIYNGNCYEQNVNLEEEIKNYSEKYKDNELGEKIKEKIKEEIKTKINILLEFGMNVKQILKNTITYDKKEKTFDPIYKVNKTNDDIYIYFNKIENNDFVIIKDEKKNKIRNRVAITFDKIDKKFNQKECKIYDCKSMNLMKYKNDYIKNKENIYLYKVDYSFSFISLLIEKSITTVFLSCRYLENYFRIQCQDRILNIFYEDFVTCIKGRNLTKKEDDIFYTGLLNGKLTEWKIIPFIDNLDKKKNYKLKCIYNFEIKEMKKVYAHQSSITAIEIYPNQNIIITSGEDKFIYIRKIFDFELLTVIDLTYTFGNPIISQTINIFPSLIKVSELNLLYVLFYDYDSKKTFIRGYNLNGLFFAQTDPLYFKDNKLNLQFNSISFTKNSNLIVGFYNTNKFYVLKASNLAVLWIKEIMNEEDKIKKNGTKMVEYNYKNGEFYFLYEDKFIITTLQEKDGVKEFDSF